MVVLGRGRECFESGNGVNPREGSVESDLRDSFGGPEQYIASMEVVDTLWAVLGSKSE